MVARYVGGKLSETEAAAFEDYCVAHPDLARDVALERKMSQALSRAVEESPERFAFRAPRQTWIWAAAACAVLAVPGVFVVREYLGHSSPGVIASLESGSGVLPHIRLAEMRGAAIPNLGADSNSLMEIDLVAQFDANVRYQIALRSADDAGNPVIAQIESVLPVSTTNLLLQLDGTRIPPGGYLLTATPESAGRTLEFAFRKD